MISTINIENIKEIALKAGSAILEIYQKNYKIEYKDDKSPLTDADIKANEIICEALEKLYPDIPILSEENKEIAYDERKDWEYYWCIDPIDGTKEFINKNDEFTVNIALINKNLPVLGVVYAPAINDIYYAKQGSGAFKNDKKLPLQFNANTKEKITVVASKSHLTKETQDYIDALDTKEVIQISKGSSLKLCMVAEGLADIYPRFAPTKEWDIAAAHAIVLESGKHIVQYNSNKPIIYNKNSLVNPWFIVVGRI